MQIAPEGFSAITLHSLAAFLLALGWVGLLFFAIAGYGALLLRALQVRVTVVLAALAGIAVTIFTGGLLNEFSLITSPVLLVFILVGLLAAAFFLRQPGGLQDQKPIRKTAAHRRAVCLRVSHCGFCA
jgi:hypothetical protein